MAGEHKGARPYSRCGFTRGSLIVDGSGNTMVSLWPMASGSEAGPLGEALVAMSAPRQVEGGNSNWGWMVPMLLFIVLTGKG